jgi:hypothetical protein
MAEEISPLENHGWWMQQLRKDAKANRPEALRLADALEAFWGADIGHDRERQAAAELRRLHAENERLSNLCYDYTGQITALRAAEQMRTRIDAMKERKKNHDRKI